MSKLKVLAITIKNGAIYSDFYKTVETQKAFLSEKSVIEVFHVDDWRFKKIHLTHGSRINGEGWAFYR